MADKRGSSVPSVDVVPVTVPDRAVRRFHCGALDTLPFYSVDLGGYSFPRTTEIVTVDKQTRETIRTPRPGAFYELSDQEVNRIKAAIARKVVRWAAKDKSKGFILNVQEADGSQSKRYRKLDSDEPLGKFVYMKEVPLEMDIKPGDPLIS